MSNNRQTKKEGRGWPLSGDWTFYVKNKLKSEIFNAEKKLSIKMFFFVITNYVKWKISTDNLVTFKRWDGVIDEKV